MQWIVDSEFANKRSNHLKKNTDFLAAQGALGGVMF